MIQHRTTSRTRNAGIVLLEVVLALALLVATVTTVAGSIASAYRGIERLDLANRGADLAVTVMSELQIGLIAVENSGPNAFEEGPEGWTWQVAVEPVLMLPDGPSLARVDVIVARPPDYTVRQSTMMLLPQTTISVETTGAQ